MIIVYNTKVRNSYDEKDKMGLHIVPFIFGKDELQQEIKQEKEANPPLNLQIPGLRKKWYIMKSIHGYTDNKEKAH